MVILITWRAPSECGYRGKYRLSEKTSNLTTAIWLLWYFSRSLLRTGSNTTLWGSAVLDENHDIFDTNVLHYICNSFLRGALTKILTLPWATFSSVVHRCLVDWALGGPVLHRPSREIMTAISKSSASKLASIMIGDDNAASHTHGRGSRIASQPPC